MNSSLLKSFMVKYHDTQKSLANATGISVSNLNAKINGQMPFRQDEISLLIKRYALDGNDVMAIFFAV